jgi:hypothetical protein
MTNDSKDDDIRDVMAAEKSRGKRPQHLEARKLQKERLADDIGFKARTRSDRCYPRVRARRRPEGTRGDLEGLARSFFCDEAMNLRKFRRLLACSSGVNFDHVFCVIAANFLTASSMVSDFSLRFMIRLSNENGGTTRTLPYSTASPSRQIQSSPRLDSFARCFAPSAMSFSIWSGSRGRRSLRNL